MTRASAPGTDSRRGAALFIVLLFSAFVAALAAAAMRTSLSGVRAAAVFADGVRADQLGLGAGDILAYRLSTGGDAAKRGGSIAVRLPDADVSIDYLSESARVDVNLAPLPLLQAVVGAAGADPSEAEAVAGRIARFRADATAAARRQASGAGGAGGLAAITAAVAASGPAPAAPASLPIAIRDVSDVERAWGLDAALARRLSPVLTVSNGAATVDPVLAGRAVLTALLGADERVDDYLQRRKQGFTDSESALELLPVPSRAFAGFTDSPAVRAVVRVRVGHRLERRYELVMAPPTGTPQAAAPVPPGEAPPPGADPTAAAPPAAVAPPPNPDAPAVLVSWRKLW